MRLNIRPFTLDDIHQLTELWKELQTNPIASGGFSLLTDENIARWQRFAAKFHEEDENQIPVADIDGKIAGYVLFQNRAEFPLETTYTWASINELYVHVAYRRRGISTKLMEQAIDYLRSIGVTHVRLNVMVNNHAAISLYRKLGFRDLQLRMQMKLTGKTIGE